MAAQTLPVMNPELTKFFTENPDGVDDKTLKELQQGIINQVKAKTKTKTKTKPQDQDQDQEETTKGKRGRRTTKEPRDPNLPKRPKNAFMLFSESVREEVKAVLIAKSDDGKIRVADISKVCGEWWKVLTAEDKKPFEEANAEAKADYEKAMEAYYEQFPDKKVEKATKKAGGGAKRTPKAKKAAFSAEDGLPTTPEGFSGAYTGYLKGTVKDPETNKNIQKKFADFNDAVAEAIRLGDACGGITRTGKGYAVRSGKEVKTNSSAGEGVEISWVKGDGSGIDAETLSTEQTAEPSPAPSEADGADFDAPTDEDEMPPLEEPEPDIEPTPSPEPVKEPEPEPEDEEEDDEEEGEEVDPDDLEKWEHNGVMYYVDEENDVMTMDGEVIGKRIKIGGAYKLKH